MRLTPLCLVRGIRGYAGTYRLVLLQRLGPLSLPWNWRRLSELYDLQSIAVKNSSQRKQEAERAEKIVELEVDRFASRMKSLAVVPTILSLQEYCETIRQAEIDRLRGRLGQISPDQEAAIEAMTRGIINKLLHTPITTLKSSAAEPEAATIHEMIRRIFNLSEKGGKRESND